MILKNLFSGKPGNNRHREYRLMDMGRGEERVRYMERVTWKLAKKKKRIQVYDSTWHRIST